MTSPGYENVVAFLHSEIDRHNRLAKAYARGTVKVSRVEQVMGEAFHRVEAKHLVKSLKAMGVLLPESSAPSVASPNEKGEAANGN